ncbi:CDGSH iron-sulfur domain-containing protein [Methanolobus bombayensis]|uniref:CDGSH iron-sulfur domain-containing protein n=1 Tax=Methanolobus bombayensis TaxID=38023 RepID=UPI001AE1BC54|nr:CDGSH iron-sulfur domain-containing protein [Methanolobus bombayensis]MBP1909371.1 CDGSH-type Zn-finger protein [Methanolobus bombayensis]
MKSKEVIVEISKDGPYIVKNVSALINSKNENLETQPVMDLCRCGGSGNKPFCDGTHIKIGFKDEKN